MILTVDWRQQRLVLTAFVSSCGALAAVLGGTVFGRRRRSSDRDGGGAEYWLRRAAEAGVGEAMHNLGVLALQRSDVREAERWFTDGASAGFLPSMRNVAILLLDRDDETTAVSWLRKAAERGDVEAMNLLASRARAYGDTDEADMWTRRADEKRQHQDVEVASAVLSIMNPDDERSAEEPPHPMAVAAFIAAFGKMQQGDLAGAEAAFTVAADIGHAESMYNLGTLAMRRGDPRQARSWFQRAAQAGDPNAMGCSAAYCSPKSWMNTDTAVQSSALHRGDWGEGQTTEPRKNRPESVLTPPMPTVRLRCSQESPHRRRPLLHSRRVVGVRNMRSRRPEPSG
jgi:TPR repeat protein